MISKNKVAAAVQRHFFTGILIFVPMALTIYLFSWLDGIIVGIVANVWRYVRPDDKFALPFPGVGLVFTVLLIYVIGVVSSNFIGRAIVVFYEGLLNTIPGVRWFYVASKQFLEGVFKLTKEMQEGGGRFRGAVLVEFPRKGVYSIGFVTGEPVREMRSHATEVMVNVFVPTTPNPTSGFYMMVPQAELKQLDMPVEQAFRLLVSAGMSSEPAEGKPRKLRFGHESDEDEGK
jgi:uncharacterized membrane protein